MTSRDLLADGICGRGHTINSRRLDLTADGRCSRCDRDMAGERRALNAAVERQRLRRLMPQHGRRMV